MSATLERVAREAAPGERAAVIALTLAAYEQYDATMPPGAWLLYAAAIRETLSDEASGALIVVAEGASAKRTNARWTSHC